MFCCNCGKRIDDDARFCEHCGMPIFPNLTEEKLRILHEKKGVARAAQSEEKPEPPLGASRLLCPSCGMRLPEDSRFCGFCGREMVP